MESLTSFVASLTWQDWATAVGILFGIVTLLAYLDQKRAAKKQKSLMDFVNRHLDKDISEETIQQLKAQQVEMQEQVRLHIPALARAAVLKEQANSHAQAITYHYKEWKKVNSELESSPSQGAIDPDIESIIIDRISPRYEKQWELDTLRNRITAFSVAIALSSTFLFYPINLLVGVPLAIPLGKGLIDFIKLQGASVESVKYVKYGLMFAYVAVVLWIGFFAGYFALYESDQIDGIIGMVVFPISVAALLYSYKLYKKLNELL
ncbi:MAG: hypothetical protein D3906_04970 [Candidatus Electrothrix sp. AUS1_2]|nr:hypothetical protein [Candidatus Electrothrix sp. AUS1_2]